MSKNVDRINISNLAYQKIKDMSRSEIRYRLYRLKNNREVDLTDGIREYYENQPGFLGFDLFADQWDIGNADDRFKIKKRLLSELEEWDAIVRQHIR